MHTREDQPDYQSALYIFCGVGLIWLFMIIWALYGMLPVVMIAVILNHIITRIGVVIGSSSISEERQ